MHCFWFALHGRAKRKLDRERPITQAEMREDEAIEQYLGDKETFNRFIKDMRREVARKVEALARKYGLECRDDTRLE